MQTMAQVAALKRAIDCVKAWKLLSRRFKSSTFMMRANWAEMRSAF
jgi:hypothetical protein